MALSKDILEKTKKALPTIEQIAIELLIEAYNVAILKKEYDLSWEEEQITQYLLDLMKNSELKIKNKLVIGVEKKLNNSKLLPIGNNHPKKLPRIDISIVSWNFNDTELEYFFEAKNLSENTWCKCSGSQVVGSSYQRRYITTGIENFRIDRYYNGSIVGYIVEGNTFSIINKINNRLIKDSNTVQTIKKSNFTSTFNEIYNSKHITPSSDEIEIKHIFLKF